MAGYQNIFHKISDSIEDINETIKKDDLDDLTGLGVLSGTFRARNRTNSNGISNSKSTFVFKDDFVTDLGVNNISYKDKSVNTLFGEAVNARTKKSGDKKYDYLDANGKKVATLTIEEDYVKDFESGDLINAYFEADLDDSEILISTMNGKHFNDHKIMTIDFTSDWL